MSATLHRGAPASRVSVRKSVSAVLHLPGALIRALLLGLLWLYQHLVSPLLGPRCRYYPSCSNYAVGALRSHGAAKGTVLAVWRVCRCHPWAAGGIDPVPRPGHWRADPEPPTNLDAGDAGTTTATSAARVSEPSS